MSEAGRFAIKLDTSVCTDNPTGTDIYPFGAGAEAQHVSQSGIERQGGLTNLYENFRGVLGSTTAKGTITTDGRAILAGDEVYLQNFDGTLAFDLGNVGPLTVYNRGSLPGYLDAAWTADDTIMAVSLVNGVIYVSDIDPATGALVVKGGPPPNPRGIIAVGLVTANIKSISLIRYVDMHWSDNQEFYIRYYTTTEDQIVKEAGGGSITKVATNAINYAGFAHRLAANRYVWGDQGVASTWQMGDILFGGAGYTTQTNAKWVVIDRWRGLADSRAVFTFDVYKDAGNTLTGISTAGYDGAGAYSAAVADKGLALAAVTATLSNKYNGPGWSEATYTRSDTGTNIYSYIATKLTHNATAYYDVVQTQTQTPMNGYGKLSDIDGNHTFLVNWKVLMVNGVPSALAASGISASTTNDHLGVMMTNLGEFDPYYVPHVVDTAAYSRIIYRYNGVLFFIDVRTGVGHTVEKISDTIYQVNCLSPINIVDTTTNTLNLGANDYNGRLRWSSAGAITTSSKMSSVLGSAYGAGVDVGDKLTTQTVASGIGIPYGIEVPKFWIGPQPYSVRIFSVDVYYQSSVTQGTFYTDLTLTGILYVADTRLPFAMGYSFGNRCMFTDLLTVFTGVGVLGSTDVNYGYAGYELGNQTTGLMDAFVLFGERYLFDDFNVYRSFFAGPIYTGKTYVATAEGMAFLAYSTTEAFFLSAFDNSVWAFDGGRALTKIRRMNDVETIINGVYSTKDGTLLLQTATTLIWIRDSVISQSTKSSGLDSTIAGPADFQPQLFDTQAGIVLWSCPTSGIKLGGIWQYTFQSLGLADFTGPGGALPYTMPAALTFQSAYFGATGDMSSVAMAFDLTIYSPSKAAADIQLSCSSFDQDVYSTKTRNLHIAPADWNTLGIFRCRIIPETERCIAASVGFYCATKVVLTGVTMEYAADAAAIPRASRSV